MTMVPTRVGMDLALPERTMNEAVRTLRFLVHLQGVGEVVVLSLGRVCIGSELGLESVQI